MIRRRGRASTRALVALALSLVADSAARILAKEHSRRRWSFCP
jgi:hypothetical protein